MLFYFKLIVQIHSARPLGNILTNFLDGLVLLWSFLILLRWVMYFLGKSAKHVTAFPRKSTHIVRSTLSWVRVNSVGKSAKYLYVKDALLKSLILLAFDFHEEAQQFKSNKHPFFSRSWTVRGLFPTYNLYILLIL